MIRKTIQDRLDRLDRLTPAKTEGRPMLTTGERRRSHAGLTLKLCGQTPTPEAVEAFIGSGDYGASMLDVEHWRAWRAWAKERPDPVRVRLFSVAVDLAIKLRAMREEFLEYFAAQAEIEGDVELAARMRASDKLTLEEEEARRVLARLALPIPRPVGGGGPEIDLGHARVGGRTCKVATS
jgi:hypothetical protein